ncbi:MAG: M23 family metallopeptidase [Treponema sp.]|nr:M23 family metallopeptidase [Treponema sp.]
MKKILKYFLFFISTICFAFEWPVNENTLKNLYISFAQKRGESFVQSIVFTESNDVYSCEAGKVLVCINNNTSDSGWFDSPLGNAIILSHTGNLLSIYSNLDKIFLTKEDKSVQVSEKIATSGFSGWQEGLSSFEFSIADTKNQTIINPLVLMNKENLNNPVIIKNVVAINKKGNVYDLSTQKYLSAGTYMLYRENSSMPFKTQVSVNGAAVETVSYDILSQINKQLTVQGKKNYNVDSIYVKDNRQFLAEVVLSRGKNTIIITTFDINGNERNVRFFVDVN